MTERTHVLVILEFSSSALLSGAWLSKEDPTYASSTSSTGSSSPSSLPSGSSPSPSWSSSAATLQRQRMGRSACWFLLSRMGWGQNDSEHQSRSPHCFRTLLFWPFSFFLQVGLKHSIIAFIPVFLGCAYNQYWSFKVDMHCAMYSCTMKIPSNTSHTHNTGSPLLSWQVSWRNNGHVWEVGKVSLNHS